MNYQVLIQKCFLQLQNEGLILGFEELFDALNIVEANSLQEDELLSALSLIWCKSTNDDLRLKYVWTQLTAIFSEQNQEKASLRPESQQASSQIHSLSPNW